MRFSVLIHSFHVAPSYRGDIFTLGIWDSNRRCTDIISEKEKISRRLELAILTPRIYFTPSCVRQINRPRNTPPTVNILTTAYIKNSIGSRLCDPDEQCSCSLDCGTTPSTETDCSDGIDNDCDGNIDCSDGDCSSSDEYCSSLPKGDPCMSNEQCQSGSCHSIKLTCK